MDFSKINRRNLIIISIYIIGFSIGTISHSIDIVLKGFLGYTFAPFILNVFWTSLIFLDPLTILLLLFKYRTAIWLAAIIMILDISINLIYGFYTSQISILLGLTTQIPFGIFVFFTVNRLYQSNSIKHFLTAK
ncbi:hypothetical protein CH368_16760 [Leptospira levettii]|nr:hypothetical protein CH368_16760 [Leptospira levettii]